MRWLAILFVILIAALQYPMWLGKGGWLQVRETDRQLAAQREANGKLKARNEGLDADVRDLKTGSEAIEERARSELGMIRNDEVFFQVQPGVAPTKVPPGVAPTKVPPGVAPANVPAGAARTPGKAGAVPGKAPSAAPAPPGAVATP